MPEITRQHIGATPRAAGEALPTGGPWVTVRTQVGVDEFYRRPAEQRPWGASVDPEELAPRQAPYAIVNEGGELEVGVALMYPLWKRTSTVVKVYARGRWDEVSGRVLTERPPEI